MNRLALWALVLTLAPPAAPRQVANLGAIYEPTLGGIRITAPIAGIYMLIEHTPDAELVRDPVVTLAINQKTTFRMRSQYPHHVQTWSVNAGEPMTLYKTRLFTLAPYVYFYPMVANGAIYRGATD